MERVEILIIGGGVIGLAVANTLSEDFDDVVLVEKEETFGRHTSSRNSEVLHSGIYYPQNSLKAEMCVNGLQLVYQFAREHNVPHHNCGKLVVATGKDEIPALLELKANGERNGVQGLRIIDSDKCKEIEPRVKAVKAMQVASTGIIDTHKFMQALEEQAEKKGAFLVYDMEVISIDTLDDGYIVNFADGETFAARVIINCAGLHSDKIAEMAGINLDKTGLRLHWCKGEYFKISKLKDVKTLIYPLPDPQGIYLGIHLTINLMNEVRFGPSAYYVDELTYKMDETYKPDFVKSVSKYIDIDPNRLLPDDCGIRPKLQPEGGEFRDFYIEEESEKGLPGFINCIGIESPGLTAALAIAEKVKEFVVEL